MKQLTTELLAGYRHIGAIRPVADIQRADASDERIEKRNVGGDGSSAWNCERAFALSEMQLPPLAEKTVRPATVGHSNAALSLDGFVSDWMRRLTGAGLKPNAFEVSHGGSFAEAWRGVPPTGFLRSAAPPEYSKNLSHSEPLLNVVEHPCFGLEPQYPKQMSSGFHQLFPIVVQAGIMGKYETVAVENPESHLHPKLQLDIAEFVLHQAHSGKQFIVETHSDLFVSRVLREIISEEIGIGQENVRIYFSRLELGADGFLGAVVEEIRTGSNGVENCPPDFMDVVANDARRMLDTLFGAPTEDDDTAHGAGSSAGNQ